MRNRRWDRIRKCCLVVGATEGLLDEREEVYKFLERVRGVVMCDESWFVGHLWQYVWGLRGGIEEYEVRGSVDGVPNAEEFREWCKGEFEAKKGYLLSSSSVSGESWLKGKLSLDKYLKVEGKKRVYSDPLLDEYYRGLRKHYLDYVSVFDDMGIDESDWQDLVESKGFKGAYKRAQGIVVMRAVSQMGKEGMEDGVKGKVDSFLRNLQEDNNEGKLLLDELVGGREEKRVKSRVGGKKVFIGKMDSKDLRVDSGGALESELEGGEK